MINKIDKKWFKAAGIRAIKTFFQSLVATAGTATVLDGVDWLSVLSSSALAAICSLGMSLAGLPELKGDLVGSRWIAAAGIRAIKTFFQIFVSTIGTATVLGSVNWVAVLSASATAAILSLATSLAGLPELKG